MQSDEQFVWSMQPVATAEYYVAMQYVRCMQVDVIDICQLGAVAVLIVW